jgi:hypothetical protein
MGSLVFLMPNLRTCQTMPLMILMLPHALPQVPHAGRSSGIPDDLLTGMRGMRSLRNLLTDPRERHEEFLRIMRDLRNFLRNGVTNS